MLKVTIRRSRVTCRVYIVAQLANRYIVAFHLAILYDVYLPAGGVQ